MNTTPETLPTAPAESSDVVRRIIHYIKSENLKPGDRLPSIREFAQLWRLKWGLIRDGLLRAQTIGIICLKPRSGAYVKQFDYRQLADLLGDITELAIRHTNPRQLYLYDARLIIETETCRRAAMRHTPEDVHKLHDILLHMKAAQDRMEFLQADEQFHLAIAQINGNPVITTMLEALLAMLRPDRALMRQPRIIKDNIHEHRQLYKAIINEDSDLAAELSARAINKRRQALLDRINCDLKLGSAFRPARNDRNITPRGG